MKQNIGTANNTENVVEVDKIIQISMLMDFYGQLLTKRQYNVLDMHYNNDYSLSEIAENLGISRQGAYDNIKKGRDALFEFEEKLKLLGRFETQKTRIQKMVEKLEVIENTDKLDGELKHNITDIKLELIDIIDIP